MNSIENNRLIRQLTLSFHDRAAIRECRSSWSRRSASGERPQRQRGADYAASGFPGREMGFAQRLRSFMSSMLSSFFGGGNAQQWDAALSRAYCQPNDCQPNDCRSNAGQQEGWKSSEVIDGKATMDLGKNYKLSLNEGNSEMVLLNKETGQQTRVWGDPHIDWQNDGQTADDVDFKNTVTFQMRDGTKATIDTEPAYGYGGATFANEVTVTKGDHAFVIGGLSQNRQGDLSVQHRMDGRALDRATDDGYVLRERPDGRGWISATLGRRPSRSELDESFT